MATNTAREIGPTVGIIGAGRLATALRHQFALQRVAALSWSRRFGLRGEHFREQQPPNIVSLENLLDAQVLFSCIPSCALIELAASSKLREFPGVIFATGIDLPVSSLESNLSGALTMRVSPSIGQSSLRLIALRGTTEAGDHRRQLGTEVLELLGSVDWIEDEVAFELAILLAGPMATLLSGAIRRFAENLARCSSAESHRVVRIMLDELGHRIGYDGSQSRHQEELSTTPGGVTELAVKHVDPIADQLSSALGSVTRHVELLRADLPSTASATGNPKRTPIRETI